MRKYLTNADLAECVKVLRGEHPETFRTDVHAKTFIRSVYGVSVELHGIYERQCKGHQTADGRWDEAAANAEKAREERVEKALRALFFKHGVGLYLQGDPRGHPVGFLTPKTRRYNTMGGAESGWRI